MILHRAAGNSWGRRIYYQEQWLLGQLSEVYRIMQSLQSSEKSKRIEWGFLKMANILNILLSIAV